MGSLRCWFLRFGSTRRRHGHQPTAPRYLGCAVRTHRVCVPSTKLVDGKVKYISGDRMVDRQSNSAVYVAHIEADASKLKEAGDMKLLAGMPVEVYIEGDRRTVFQYLTEPLMQLVQRAGRER